MPPLPPPIQYSNDLGQMVAPLRKTSMPTAFGDGYDLKGDPSKIAPSNFPKAQAATVDRQLMDSNVGGLYNVESNAITVNDLGRFIKGFQNKGIPAYEQGSNATKPNFFMPAVVPHEVGHAIYHNMIDKAHTLDNPDHRYWVDALNEWDQLHDSNLKDNKALGKYHYTNDSSHSFADVYSAWTSNPALIKNLFPDIYDYFARISTPRK